MVSLVDCLKAFNRKERYWLLKDAHGESFDKLDKIFITKLNDTLNIDIPDNAWWALDYHFDWISAAVWCFINGNNPHAENLDSQDPSDSAARKLNPVVTFSKHKESKNYIFENSLIRDLFKFTIEDIDLIISFNEDSDRAINNTILLIEAKADSSWSSDQFISKLNRLVFLRRFLLKQKSSERKPQNDEDSQNQVNSANEIKNANLVIKLILTSPAKPTNLIMDPSSLERRNEELQKKKFNKEKRAKPIESEIKKYFIKTNEYSETLKWLGWEAENNDGQKLKYFHIELLNYNNNSAGLRSVGRCKKIGDKQYMADKEGDYICIV